MGKKYPFISNIDQGVNRGLCAICGGVRANGRVMVRVNEFAGDDEVHKVHAHRIAGKRKTDILKEVGYGVD